MSMKNLPEERLKERCMAKGIGIGFAFCIPLGIALCVLTGQFGLLGVGPAIGISIGVQLGEAFYRRELAAEVHAGEEK
jgi:hypothetical protein